MSNFWINNFKKKRCHQLGSGTPKNLEEAVRIYERVEEEGVYQALNSHAYILSEEKEYPRRNVKKAIKIYKKGIKKNDLRSIYNLANIYMNGDKSEGIDRKIQLALDLYDQAANLGNSQSMVSLGVFYQDGMVDEGFEKDTDKAIRFYERAVELGIFNLYYLFLYIFIYF